MTDISAVDNRPQPGSLAAIHLVSEASVGDYLALMKPRVMSLVVFTALVGLVVAPGHLNPVVGFVALLCIAIGAGAAGALNMWYDADIDAVMTRTADRPIPAGRVTRGEALGFGMTLAVGSVAVLGLAANWLAAGLLASSFSGRRRISGRCRCGARATMPAPAFPCCRWLPGCRRPGGRS